MGETAVVALRSTAEEAMVEQEVVRQMRVLAEAGWGAKRIAREVGVARNTVRRYLRARSEKPKQERPRARRLGQVEQQRAVELWQGPAEGNAVVVQALLSEQGVKASVRTVQRAVREQRQQTRAAQVATVRFETAPGQQLQVDFGEKKVSLGGHLVKVFLLVAVLSFSRRLFVRAFLAERGDDWREGIAAAFQHFGGVPLQVLVDNARPLVEAHDTQAGTVRFHPAFLGFCRDWDVTPKACRPYRARTKGKTESGVKYVKRNALAGRHFDSFSQLESHLAQWVREADAREHGTTHERPLERFEREEHAALRPLPARALPRRQQRLKRKVANDALVDVDTVRYSVPHRLVRQSVEVAVEDEQVRIFHAGHLVATHARSRAPHERVVNPEHWEGLWRPHAAPAPDSRAALATLGRTLEDYAAVVEQGSERGAA
jgi:transposase